jgi:hypothetical protein
VTGDFEQHRHQRAVTDRLAADDVEDLAVARVVDGGTQERVDRVVDEDEIP